MSDSIEMTSCIRHKDTARYFIYYEDFQDLSKKHPDKLAAFLRVLEVKTNKRIASYAVLLEDAVNNNQPLPMLNLWHEVSYNDFVNWSLETLGRSSFQIADKVAEEMLLVRSKVLTRKLRPDDEHSPELTYKVYILVLENVQATIDGKEIPITGEAYEKYGEEPPVIENIPLLKKTWGMLEKTRGDMLKKTAPPVEKNYFKDKNKDNTFKENNKEDTLASDDALSLLQEITNRFGGVEQVLSLLEKLSTQAQQLPTSNTQDKPTSTEADEQASYSHPATQNELPGTPDPSEKPIGRKPSASKEEKPKVDVKRLQTLLDSFIALSREHFNQPDFTAELGSARSDNYKGALSIINIASTKGVRDVYQDFWEESDKNDPDTHWWRDPKHLTFKAFCRGYATRIASIQFNADKAQKKSSQPHSVSGYRNYTLNPSPEMFGSTSSETIETTPIAVKQEHPGPAPRRLQIRRVADLQTALNSRHDTVAVAQ